MNKSDVTKMLKTAQRFVSRRSPEILTGIGIVGLVSTTVLAVRATPKALELIEEEKTKTDADTLKPVEVVKVAWKPYIPAAITGIVSIGCIVGASSVSARRQAALYSAYKLSETAFADYKEKVVETIGEKKEKAVRDKIAKDRLEKSPVTKSEVIMTGAGESLFYDPISDRYFKSDIETVRKVINDLNYAMSYGSEMYVSLSQLYDELGLKHTSISDDIGWNISNGLIETDFSAQITDDGRPCVVLDFLLVPSYNYESSY